MITEFTEFKIFENYFKDIVKILQDYLQDKNWIDIKFKRGVEPVSAKINEGRDIWLVSGEKYQLSIAKRDEVKGWFLISGKYKEKSGQLGGYSLLHTPNELAKLLKFVNKTELEKIKFLDTTSKYNL